MFNSTFYPTPSSLVGKMIAKIQGAPKRILEPSAGKGDIVEGLQKRFENRRCEVCAIELDPDLQATLRGKKVKLIDSDFLEYAGHDKFDCIVANPPFDDGDKHLLKAIDIMYRGQIIFLLNAETLRNPHTNTRKLLARRLDELGAQIEFIPNAFRHAERKTDVEVALINIKINRKIEDDLFAGADDKAAEVIFTVKDKHEVSTGKTIVELVAEYNQTIESGQETIMGFYRNYRKVGKYLCLNEVGGKDRYYSSEDLTTMVQDDLNTFLVNVRRDYWRRTLDLPEVKSRLTSKKSEEFNQALNDRCHMEFTESNIRQFVLNLIGGYEQTLTEAVLDLFDMFTIRHAWDEKLWTKNIHYFNGWKTNNAYKVGRRVVIPIYGGYGEGAFRSWGKWRLDYKAERLIGDVDKVASYFSGMEDCETLVESIKAAFVRDENSGESSHFKWIAHKKGTLHLTFINEDILRRFNLVACRGKGWLPEDYGRKRYDTLSLTEKSVVDSFEGEKSYSQNVNQPVFKVSGNLLKIGHREAA